MIYAYLDGRLGNILFIIAAGASLAKWENVPFRAIADQTWGTDKYVKSLDKTILRKFDMQEQFPENVIVYNQPDFRYAPLPAEKEIVLKGGFQSEKYFDKDLVRSLFEIDQETNSYINDKFGHILSKNPVGIHVRHGDYYLYEYKHTVCRMGYFKRAMSYFDKDRFYLVMSDDIAWCKKHFKGDNFYFSENEPQIVDFYLQSKCSHHIISNSSYSWWGAWLNPDPDKKVIYPSPWFGPFYKKRLNTTDLCPDEWIAVPISGIIPLYYHAGYAYLKKIIRKIRRIYHF